MTSFIYWLHLLSLSCRYHSPPITYGTYCPFGFIYRRIRFWDENLKGTILSKGRVKSWISTSAWKMSATTWSSTDEIGVLPPTTPILLQYLSDLWYFWGKLFILCTTIYRVNSCLDASWKIIVARDLKTALLPYSITDMDSLVPSGFWFFYLAMFLVLRKRPAEFF